MKSRTISRVRRRAIVGLAASSALVGLVLPSASARADTTLIGWTVQSDANPFDFVIDNSAGLSGVHPLAEADVPEDATDFETGPFGHALASVVWPGGTAGNLGSLSGQLGLPAQLAAVLAKANDPVRAETFYPAGPGDSTYPPGSPTNGVVEMVSHADANGASASSGLSDFAVNGLFQVQGIQGSSSSSAASVATSKATGSFASLSILGGMITIGATTSTATATSDGANNVHGQASTHIGAITIDGQQVSVGNDGITVGPAQTNAIGSLTNPVIQQVNQLISTFRITMTPLPETETSQSPTETITSAGLKISLSLPTDLAVNLDCGSIIPSQASQLDVLCTLPGFLQGASLTITIGRATATAIATPPFPVELGGLGGGGTGLLGNTGGSGTAAGAAAAIQSGSDTGTAAPSLSASPVTSGTAPTTAPAVSHNSLGALTPVDLSHPIRAGLLVWLLILAVATGAGIIRMGRQLDLAPPESVCPLEESS